MSNQGSVAGWYPDPYNPAQLRYWDGTAWSESTAPAGGGGGGAGLEAPPAAFGGYPPAGGAPVWQSPTANPLGDVGDWLGRTFSVVIDRLVAVLVLLWAVPLVGYTLAVLLAAASVRNIVIDIDNEEINGFRLSQLLVALLVLLVTLLLTSLSYFTAIHQFHAGHAGRNPSLSASLAATARHLLRIIGYGLLLLLALVGAYVGLIFLIVALAAADARLVLLIFPIGLALLPLAVWLGVRLSLVAVAMVAAPSGHNPLSVSWRATAGRFWAVLGRLLVLMAIVWVAQSVAQFGLQIGLTPVLEDAFGFEIDPITDEVLLNGEPIDDIDELRVDDLIPNPAVLLLIMALYTALQAASQALYASGAAGLYVRLQAPDEGAGSEPAAQW